jgi:tripartite-type tricarboxylate transporter receptor subunit TctC
MHRMLRMCRITFTLALVAAISAHAQSPGSQSSPTVSSSAQAWPLKPVRVIAPFAPGGLADTFGRIVASKLTDAFGQPFVVENRSGAGGLVGADPVTRSAPDGYTLVVTGLGPLVVASAIAPKMPFDPVRDFTHIALFGGSPSILCIHPSLPAHTLKEFIAVAKSRPGMISYGTAGHGSTGQLVAETLKRAAGIDIEHIPYKGASMAVADVVGGHITAMFVTVTATASQLKAGKVRALAMTSAQRLPDYPDVPTFRESGYPQLVASVWFSLSGPPGLPADIVNRLNAEVRRILHLPDVRERLRSQGIEPNTLDPRQFTEYVAMEFKRWAPLVRQSAARGQ